MTKLVKAVLKHSKMTKEELKSVRNASDGYSGFTYYKDTCKFYDNNKDLIWDRLNEVAELFGTTPSQLIASFGYADSIIDEDTRKNALSWFALEEASYDLNE